MKIQLIKERSVSYPGRKIECPEDGVSLVQEFLENEDRETFLAVYLNTKNEPTAIQTISVGTLNSSLVHPREVFKGALLSNAASVILAHNHPSGNPEPSGEDIEVTKRLQEAGRILGIEVLDHLVIGSEGRFASIRAKGLL